MKEPTTYTKPTIRLRLLVGAGVILGLAQIAACSSAKSPAAKTPAMGSVAVTSPVAPSSPAASASTPTADTQKALPVPGEPATPGGTGVRLQAVDGGAGYYAKFSPSLPVAKSFFPIGVWLAAVNQRADVTSDRAAGLNTYVTLTNNSSFGLVGRSGMYFISNQPQLKVPNAIGWYVNDETDMWGGPGSAAWTGTFPGRGPICAPATAACGYTVQSKLIKKLPVDRRFKYSNYGLGVTFWESNSQAARFVNDYQQVVSADNYWFTDEDICVGSQGGKWFNPRVLVNGNLPPRLCHLAANYARTVRRIRELARDSKPVWAYVELGHPFTQGNWPSITPAEVSAAVWQSLIAGARGIIYFNHSFGGRCQTDNVLRDPCYAGIRATVTRLDRKIKSFAPVLNAPFADHVVTASRGVDISARWYHGHFYILAGSREPGAQIGSFSMPCVGSATITVLRERRTINMPHGTFTDHFSNENTVHIYRIDGGSSCGAY